MTPQDFNTAVLMVASSNSCKVQFNVPVTDNYSSTYQLLILESNASIINQLRDAGYSLSMTSKGLAVDKY